MVEALVHLVLKSLVVTRIETPSQPDESLALLLLVLKESHMPEGDDTAEISSHCSLESC